MRRLWLACLLSLALAVHAQPGARLAMVGELEKPLEVTAVELRAMPPAVQAAFTQTRGAPGQETRSTVRGVRLVSLIERAGLRAEARADWKHLVVVVTATDGYHALFTWAELTNTPGGEGVLVLFERDGRPLDAREGDIALISTNDLRLGARHVRNVVKIEVRRLAP